MSNDTAKSLKTIPVIVCLILMGSLMFLNGCSASKDTASDGNMQVIQATFHQWSVSPSDASDLPERGTDLAVTVNEWPDEYVPQYIVYNNHRTLAATVADKSGGLAVITGRIIRSSGMLNEQSERVEQSDRLVYSDPDGETGYIEIDSWDREE